MYQDKTILAVITARGGSKGIPGKNIKPLLGKPLIAYSIAAGKNSRYLDRCIVSTDSDDIIEVAKKYEADIPFKRPAVLALDETPHLPVLQHAVNWLSKNQGQVFDYVMILQPTSPLRTSEDIDNCIKIAVDNQADSVMSMVELTDFSLVKIKKIEDGLIKPFFIEEGNFSARRQKSDKAHRRNCAVYLTKTDLIMTGDIFGQKSLPYLMPRERSLDINELFDFELVEFLLAKWQQR